MRSKWLLAIAVCVGLAIFMSQQAYAHVLITNETNTVGSVLHITPDDDPIAGKSAHIFYDIQSEAFASGEYTASLTIRNTVTEVQERVDMTVSGSYISGEYVFPVQGVYTLSLDIDHGRQSDRFVVTQRVSRGTPAATQVTQPRHRWAEFLLVLSGAGCGVLALVAATRARRILKQSR